MSFRASELSARSKVENVLLVRKNRNLGLSFAKLMINKLEMYWINVLFADESKLKIFGSDKHKIIWIKN